MAYIKNESYLHEHAKNLLAEALRNEEKKNNYISEFGPITWRANYGVFTELEFHEHDHPYYFECSKGLIEDYTDRPEGNYTEHFDPSIDRGRILFVPDICIFHKGTPTIFIEVVHKNTTPKWKINKINDFFDGFSIDIYEVSAFEIMSQVGDLSKIAFKYINK